MENIEKMENIEFIKEDYHQFNMEQILPILIDLKLAKEITEEFIFILKNYKDFLYDMIHKVDNNESTTIELQKNTFDKNFDIVISQIKSIIYKQNPLKKIGSKKESIYEKLHRGYIYRYKIKNHLLAENPQNITVEKLIISFCPTKSENFNINIGNSDFKIFENNSSIKNININIINIQIITSWLDIILMQINTHINIINDDVIHFQLFDEKYLNI